MAKGMDVEVTIKDLERFLEGDVETIKTGIMLADEAGIGDEAMEMLCCRLDCDSMTVVQLKKVLKEKGVVVYGRKADLIARLKTNNLWMLGMIGDVRAVEPLIKALGDKSHTGDTTLMVRTFAAKALDKLGWVPETDGQRAAYLIAVEDWESLVKCGEPAVVPLIKALGDLKHRTKFDSAVKALGKIGDKRAVEPLIKLLSDQGHPHVTPYGARTMHGRRCVVVALGDIGDERAVKPLIGMLGLTIPCPAARALEKIGKPAVEPLIKTLGNEDQAVRWGAAEALWEIREPAMEPLIKAHGEDLWKFLESDDPALVRMGLLMAEGSRLWGLVLGTKLWGQDASIRKTATDILKFIEGV